VLEVESSTLAYKEMFIMLEESEPTKVAIKYVQNIMIINIFHVKTL